MALREMNFGVARPFFAVKPQQHIGDRVKCSSAHPLASRSNQLAGSLQHFMRRLARKREQKNVGRINARINQIGHAIDECTSLPASGAGNHKRRPIACRDGRQLLGIQGCRVIDG